MLNLANIHFNTTKNTPPQTTHFFHLFSVQEETLTQNESQHSIFNILSQEQKLVNYVTPEAICLT